jgi:hypothetical protein
MLRPRLFLSVTDIDRKAVREARPRDPGSLDL